MLNRNPSMDARRDKTICAGCNEERITYFCPGCSEGFCFDHLLQHRTDLSEELDQRQNDYNKLRQELTDQKIKFKTHPSLQRIDQWEKESIDKIQHVAQYCRNRWIKFSKRFHSTIEKKLIDLAQEADEMHQGNEFDEMDLNELKDKLEKLQKKLHQIINVSIEERPTSFINQISLAISSAKDTRWKQSATTIAGGNGQEDRLDQMAHPLGIYFDDRDQTIYIADSWNHSVLQWKVNATHGQIVAGRNGQGKRLDQLDHPTNVIIDRQNNDLIIADQGNRCVVRWSHQTDQHVQIITEDIDCWGLAIHEDGTLYVSDRTKNEVRRCKKGEKQGALVAGGNGRGNRLNQFDRPIYLFVDDDHSLYVSDKNNHRVMKWMRDAKEGIIVAGGNGHGIGTTQLSFPYGIVVDQFDQIYVADWGNDRVMRWREGAKKGVIVAGGNGRGEKVNQLNNPAGLSLDVAGNLYIADYWNYRIQKFEKEVNENKTR